MKTFLISYLICPDQPLIRAHLTAYTNTVTAGAHRLRHGSVMSHRLRHGSVMSHRLRYGSVMSHRLRHGSVTSRRTKGCSFCVALGSRFWVALFCGEPSIVQTQFFWDEKRIGPTWRLRCETDLWRPVQA